MPTPRRSLAILFAIAALTSTGLIAGVAIAALVAQELLGGAAWSGLPSAITILGTATGTAVLSKLMADRGRRAGFVVGYGVAVLGGFGACAAVAWGRFSLFLVALFCCGLGHGASQLLRYVAAEWRPARSAAAIGWVVWAGTIGSIAGPAMLAPGRDLGLSLGLPHLAGPYLITATALGCALLLSLALPHSPPSIPDGPREATIPGALQVRGLRQNAITLTTMIANQIVMVLIMTMTPVHMSAATSGLGAVGLVIGAHTFGMFALSPVTGALAERFGRAPVITTGAVVVSISALLAALARSDEQVMLAIALFLLGFGWNLSFVAGSARVSDSAEGYERMKLQGVADSTIWMSAAIASFASGFLFTSFGYAALCAFGAALVALPAIVSIGWCGAPAESPASR
jgi:MFS family permease